MKNNETGKLWAGIMFIILGLIFLLEEFFPWLDFEDFWPVLIIISGVILIYDGMKKHKLMIEDNSPTETID